MSPQVNPGITSRCETVVFLNRTIVTGSLHWVKTATCNCPNCLCFCLHAAACETYDLHFLLHPKSWSLDQLWTKNGKKYSIASMAGFRSLKNGRPSGGTLNYCTWLFLLTTSSWKNMEKSHLMTFWVPPFPATLHTLPKTVELSCGVSAPIKSTPSTKRVFSNVAVHGATAATATVALHLQPPPHWTLLPAGKTKGNSRSQPSVPFSWQHFRCALGCVCWNPYLIPTEECNRSECFDKQVLHKGTDLIFSFRWAGKNTKSTNTIQSHHLRRNRPHSVKFTRKCGKPSQYFWYHLLHDNVQISPYIYIHTNIVCACNVASANGWLIRMCPLHVICL